MTNLWATYDNWNLWQTLKKLTILCKSGPRILFAIRTPPKLLSGACYRRFCSHGTSAPCALAENWGSPVMRQTNLHLRLLCSECVVHCTDFACRHCLSYLLIALSSHADDVRRAAYHCLRLYHEHLEAAASAQRHSHGIPTLLLYLVDCVRYSVGESNERLPCIVTTFLARAAHLLTNPGTLPVL